MAKTGAVDHKFSGLYACNKDFRKKKRTQVEEQEFSCKVVSSSWDQHLTKTKQKKYIDKK